jgi:hypothetical protein
MRYDLNLLRSTRKEKLFLKAAIKQIIRMQFGRWYKLKKKKKRAKS